MNIRGYIDLLIDGKKRREYKEYKKYVKLDELEKLSDRKLMIEKSELESTQSMIKMILTSIVVIFFISIVGAISTFGIHTVINYLRIMSNHSFSDYQLLEAKLTMYIVLGISAIIIVSLVVILFLFIKSQKSKKELLDLYIFEEDRRKKVGKDDR
ncbi:hypothetical protein IBB3154_128 (plasmid) [Ligilactobacillus salivarius]|uniref:hypothetical protein n=1 Tax=Ligilactobacillus salivarius TaxID=1624 RepID=UPI0013DE01F2|nr:hypothetical protein [Ligilactobacillus salivarius]QIG37459.1 hypothetical protein IBB3154_128 [Ligilactobacillus salivarius]